MSPLFLPITNHTGRINLQIQSSYKSKVSQKYVSLLYIANVYFFSQSIQNLCYSTQPVLIFQHIINIFIIELHNHLENRSFFAIQPQVLIFFSSLSHFFDPFCIILQRDGHSRYIYRDKKSGTIANLQEYGTINCVLILSMRFVNLLLPCYHFLYIFFRQVLFIRLKSTICHAKNAQFTPLGMQCLIQLQRV